MPKGKQLTIQPTKGRPMLNWVGKRPLRHVTAFPAQHVETYGKPGDKGWKDWPKSVPQGGLLFHGDNKEVLAHLLASGFRGKVDLIYIDPPFDSGADYVRKVALRGNSNSMRLSGEGYSLGEQIQYTDIWANDNYFQFMYDRLILLSDLLKSSGSLYLHCDSRRSHYLKAILDEIFGPERFLAEIVWRRTSAHSDARFFGQIHDIILFYGPSDDVSWNSPMVDYDEWYIERYYRYVDENGRRFKSGDLSAYGLSGGGYEYEWKGVQGVWRAPRETMEKLDGENKIYYTENGIPRLKQYLDEMKGTPVPSLWDDIQPLVSWSNETENYPTQKPVKLLDRIISASSNPGDLVLDCFLGSGTTAAVAQKLGRRWIGCDINKSAIQTASKRLAEIIAEQQVNGQQGRLMDDAAVPPPAQQSFAVYRVNDYDLQIQHNEAVELACQHIGIERTRSDAFFDGLLGKRLVKIIPLQHPLSLLDLEEVKNELTSRPEEERDIVLVCLGKELATDAWLSDWNKLRRKGDLPNKIEVIELRTDPRYGSFFVHKPAIAKVKVARKGDKIQVKIDDFISPSIVERLKNQSGPLLVQINDWRSMVDTVMIDPAYDGKVFKVGLVDVPEKKDDLVTGEYVLDAPNGKTTVAVKITDMLGEETLVTAEV